MIMQAPRPHSKNQLQLVENQSRIEVLDVKRLAEIPDYLFGDAAGGIFVAGDSGTGKSTLFSAFAHLFARKGMGFSLYDPAGDLFRLVRNICLDLGPSVRRRLYLVSPAGMKDLAFSIRPLFVDPTNLTPDEYAARLARRVSIAARILLHAFGDIDFNAKPLLMKWCTRVLEAAAALGLSFVDAEIFLQVGSDLFHALTDAVPDFVTRVEFQELVEMRPADRENFIASTKNRFLGLLKNPLVRNFLSGRAGNRAGARTIGDLIKENAIILWDLSPQGKLRPEDQQIMANCALSEALDAIENFAETDRVPHVIMIDELPTFLSCPATLEQLTHLLRTCRKTKLRCIGAAQGVNFFPDKQDDRALHAFIGQAATQFYFRMKDPLDAKFFAEVVALPTIGQALHTPKHIQTQDVQYQDGNDLVVLVDDTENSSLSKGQGGSETNGTNQQRNWQDTVTDGTTTTVTNTTNRGTGHADTQNDQNSLTSTQSMDALRNVVTIAEAKAGGSVRGSTDTITEATGHGEANATQRSNSSAHGGGEGAHHDTSHNWTLQDTQGTGRTYKQTLVPRLKWREIVTAVEFYTPEEIHLITASGIATQQVGHCLMYIAGRSPVRVKIALLQDPFRLTPKYAAKTEARFLEELRTRLEYQSPMAIQQDREAFLNTLLSEVRTMLHRAGGANGQLPILVSEDSRFAI